MAKGLTSQERYTKELVPKLMKELGIKNVNAVPKLNKITINAGLGSMYGSGTKDFSEFVENFRLITGQTPVINIAKKAISNFKLREGTPNGVSVNLRGKRMYDFIEKLVHIVFPRVRDFRGISDKSFDGNGNYTVGLKEHTVFPEINPDDLVKIHGIQVCINTTAKSDEEGRALLTAFGFPFKKAEEVKKEAPKPQPIKEEAVAEMNEQAKDIKAEDLPGESQPKTI